MKKSIVLIGLTALFILLLSCNSDESSDHKAAFHKGPFVSSLGVIDAKTIVVNALPGAVAELPVHFA